MVRWIQVDGNWKSRAEDGVVLQQVLGWFVMRLRNKPRLLIFKIDQTFMRDGYIWVDDMVKVWAWLKLNGASCVCCGIWRWWRCENFWFRLGTRLGTTHFRPTLGGNEKFFAQVGLACQTTTHTTHTPHTCLSVLVSLLAFKSGTTTAMLLQILFENSVVLVLVEGNIYALNMSNGWLSTDWRWLDGDLTVIWRCGWKFHRGLGGNENFFAQVLTWCWPDDRLTVWVKISGRGVDFQAETKIFFAQPVDIFAQVGLACQPPHTHHIHVWL